MKKINTDIESFFTPLSPNNYTNLPDKLNSPFGYIPHPVCIDATDILKERLHSSPLLNKLLNENGKMFGILVVLDQEEQLGFISAFSGQLGGTYHQQGFIPPVYDILDKNGFFNKEEYEISKINEEITDLETSKEYFSLKLEEKKLHEEANEIISSFKASIKISKQERDRNRLNAKKQLSGEQYSILDYELKNESKRQKSELKKTKDQYSSLIKKNKEALKTITVKIDKLKQKRKEKSAALQYKLFEHYQLLNSNGQTQNVNQIFAQLPQKVPPSSAGDCAAPKLFQFAFKHKLQPIAIAEFWWGTSPKSEIRKQGNFYPACKSKCEPILKHMLTGIPFETHNSSVYTISNKELKYIFEDKDLIVIEKPANFLSVPGKKMADSAYLRIKNKYPKATGPLLVHRLDMATSGLLLIAKNKEVHKHLQQQFADRTIVKKYIAILEGTITEKEGVIDLPIRVDLEDRPRQLVCFEHGKEAKTKYKVIEEFEGKSRIQFQPITGRTHQLRVHAAHVIGLNSPILGDPLYGNPADRLYLHAEYLEFTHPISGKRMQFKVGAKF